MNYLVDTETGDSNSSRIPAVVINLERHRERRDWFLDNAKRVQLDVRQFPAVDARDCSCRLLIDDFRGSDPALSMAEAACLLSHRRAWQYLLDSSSSFLAIFEDDAHLSEDLPRLLDPKLVPEGVHLIKLEEPCGRVSVDKRPFAPYLGRSLHRVLTRAYGSAGYIVSRRCAQRLLEISQTAEQPVDVVLFDDALPIFKEFGVLQAIPAPCVQDMNLHRLTSEKGLFTSEIEQSRQQIKGNGKRRAKTKSRVPFRNLRRYLRCVLQGAAPFHYRSYVPVDLGFPGR